MPDLELVVDVNLSLKHPKFHITGSVVMESKKRNKKAKNKQSKASASNAASGSGKTTVPNVAIIDGKSVVPDAALCNGKPTISDVVLADGNVTISEAIHESVIEKDQQTQQHGDLDSQSQAISNPHSVLDEQVDLIEMLKTLQKEIDSCIKREATLDDRIQNLCKENKSYLHDTANHAVKLEELQCEINSRILEEISLKERIEILECDKDLQISSETSKREVIDKLSSANIILQTQVMQLEESRDILIQENQQLKKSVSSLEMRIQQLEEASILRLPTVKMLKHLSVEENLLNEIHTVQLAEDPILKTAKALKAANDSYNEPQHRDATLEHTLASKIERASERNKNAISARYLLESFSDQDLESHINTEAEPHGIPPDSYHLHEVNSGQTANSRMPFTSIPVDITIVGEASAVEEVQESTEGNGSPDVLQLPLDELQMKQIKPSVESIERYENQEMSHLPLDEIQIEEINPAVESEGPAATLIEAPLIGAPFRLISFVAKYVSGADLVNEKNSTSRR